MNIKHLSEKRVIALLNQLAGLSSPEFTCRWVFNVYKLNFVR